MKPILVLLPANEITEKIFSMRAECINRGLGQEDPRGKVLPHLTLVYTKDEIDENTPDSLVKKLDELYQTFKPITLPVADVKSWENKVALMFNKSLLQTEIASAQKVFDELKLSYQRLNWDQCDLKVVRNISPGLIEETKKYIQEGLHQVIVFDRVALLDIDGEAKDILWQSNSISE